MLVIGRHHRGNKQGKTRKEAAMFFQLAAHSSAVLMPEISGLDFFKPPHCQLLRFELLENDSKRGVYGFE